LAYGEVDGQEKINSAKRRNRTTAQREAIFVCSRYKGIEKGSYQTSRKKLKEGEISLNSDKRLSNLPRDQTEGTLCINGLK
jgi:hypothetical protein